MYEEIVKKIPANVQNEIVDGNFIPLARPVTSDNVMMYLVQIWQACVDPNITVTCQVCLVDLLAKWQKLQPALLEAVKNRKLLANA